MSSILAEALADAILRAAKIHEDSWVPGGIGPVHQFKGMGQYAISLREACDKLDSPVAEPVFLLLHSNWNDALDWARANMPNG